MTGDVHPWRLAQVMLKGRGLRLMQSAPLPSLQPGFERWMASIRYCAGDEFRLKMGDGENSKLALQ